MSGAYLGAGRTEQARRLANKAHWLARERRQLGNEAYARKMIGEVTAHVHSTDVVMAETSYRQAMALALEIGMRPLVAHCHPGLSKLHRHRGDLRQTEEHLTAATTLYDQMDMAYWLQQAAA